MTSQMKKIVSKEPSTIKKIRPKVVSVTTKPSFLPPSITIESYDNNSIRTTGFTTSKELVSLVKVGDRTTFHLLPFSVPPKSMTIDGVLHEPVALNETNWVLRPKTEEK